MLTTNIYSRLTVFCWFSMVFLNGISLTAQTVNPNLVRSQVYDQLYALIEKDFSHAKKHIVLDPTINKFDKADFTDFRIELQGARYDYDEVFCGINPQLNCVKKLEIDKYSIDFVYQVHKDSNYGDFFGIYAPIDSWYQLIYQSFLKQATKESTSVFQMLFPVRHVFVQNQKQIEEILFYQVVLNEEFKIIKTLKINDKN